MKLLLTSQGWQKNKTIGKEFLKLVGKDSADVRILLVMTPTKFLRRNIYVRRQFRQFDGVKIPKQNITFSQLDKKIGKADLKNIDVIFVMGGNTFEYLQGLRNTGLDKAIKSFVKKGGVYVGLSAGSYVTCPTIEAALWKHADRNAIGLKNLRGLNLVPFLLTAHFEKELRPLIKQEAGKTKYEVIALSDEQAVLINGKERKIIGRGRKNIFNPR